MPTTLSNVEAEALGRRWLAAGGGWREGMRDGEGYIVTGIGADGIPDESNLAATAGDTAGLTAWVNAWPDLRDAATRGAALDVVRERWGDPTMHMASLRLGWVWAFRDEAEVNMIIADGLPIAGTTEPEALVAALEAAIAWMRARLAMVGEVGDAR